MMKANAGYRALAVSEAEPNHVVPLARFGGAAAVTPSAAPAPAAEKFSFFRDRAPGSGMPSKPAFDTAGKAAVAGEGQAERKSAPTLPKADALTFVAPLQSPERIDLSPWSSDESLPASVLFDGAGQNDVLRFLVDKFTLERRKGDIFTHVRPIGATGLDGDTILSFVDPAKSSLSAELIAVLVRARRSAGCDVTVIEPSADHDDAGFWQTFINAG